LPNGRCIACSLALCCRAWFAGAARRKLTTCGIDKRGTTGARVDPCCYIYTCPGLFTALCECHRPQICGNRAKNGAHDGTLWLFTAVDSSQKGMSARWMHRAVLLAFCLLLMAADGGGAKSAECDLVDCEGDPTAIDTSLLPDYWDATSPVRQLATDVCALSLTALTLSCGGAMAGKGQRVVDRRKDPDQRGRPAARPAHQGHEPAAPTPCVCDHVLHRVPPRHRPVHRRVLAVVGA